MKREPSYLALHESGELGRRAEAALEELRSCCVCPWDCGVNRLADEWRVCRTGRHARVASAFPHFGEEDCLRGWNGSGTIFFAWCNLRCVFCQNYDISQERSGQEATPRQLAAVMLRLQGEGCHNINFVTPEHVVPQVLEALPLAVDAGLRLPIVYNTSAFDSTRSLDLLDGVVDIYMPDFKYWFDDTAQRYTKSPKYPSTARTAIARMHRQVGDLVIEGDGLATRGLLVRHLVMPGGLEDAREIMRFLAEEISTETWVNIMGQYRPAGKVTAKKYAEIDRRPLSAEIEQVYELAREAGLHRFDERRAAVA